MSKCELITHKDTQVDDDILQSFKRVELEEATLLGAPLVSGSVLDSTWDDRCADLARACDRLSFLCAQDALILLQSSFSAPRVKHLLRCSPSTNNPALSKFDDILKVSIQRITNCDFSDLQWIQASLPGRDGGLGIRRVASLALPAFVASAASTLSLQADILSSCTPSDNKFFQSCLLSWSSQFGDLPEVLTRLRNDLYCVEWGVKLYSLTHPPF